MPGATAAAAAAADAREPLAALLTLEKVDAAILDRAAHLAAAAGLTAGDTLLAVDGVLCTDHQQAIKMLDMPAHTEPLKVVVMSKYAALQ